MEREGKVRLYLAEKVIEGIGNGMGSGGELHIGKQPNSSSTVGNGRRDFIKQDRVSHDKNSRKAFTAKVHTSSEN